MTYDLAIIGSGPAGLSASVYASRYGIKNVVVGDVQGGIASQTHDIGNWLGTQKIKGFEFAQNAIEHAKSYGCEIVAALVDEIRKDENTFTLFLSDGNKIEAKAVLLGLGTKHRNLGVPGEKELIGKGVSYCATCDGFFYKGKTVAVVGGSDAATSAAVFLGDIAEKVASNVNTDLWNKTYALLWRDIAMALSQNVKVEIYNSFCENINKEIKQ